MKKTTENTSAKTSVISDVKKCKAKKSFAGLGLFATMPIKKGETIIEYLGNILNNEEVAKKKKSMYLFEVNKNKTIDGTPRWNTARYANHSCEPNAESEIRKGRVFVVAIKNIEREGEITFDYGEEFFNEHIKPFGCKCKSTKCVSLKNIDKK
jgi:SET domain-containing protein